MHTYYKEEKAELVSWPQLGEGEAGRRRKGRKKERVPKSTDSPTFLTLVRRHKVQNVCLSYSANKIYITYIFCIPY